MVKMTNRQIEVMLCQPLGPRGTAEYLNLALSTVYKHRGQVTEFIRAGKFEEAVFLAMRHEEIITLEQMDTVYIRYMQGLQMPKIGEYIIG